MTLEEIREAYAQHPLDGGAHDLVPSWLEDMIAPLYAQEEVEDPIVWAKYFLPESRYTLFATEFSRVAPDGYPNLFFGLVKSPFGPAFDELGYVTLEQLESVKSPLLGLGIERDIYFVPQRLSAFEGE